MSLLDTWRLRALEELSGAGVQLSPYQSLRLEELRAARIAEMAREEDDRFRAIGAGLLAPDFDPTYPRSDAAW